MQSLNLKVFTDFNTGTARPWPGRIGGGLAQFEAAARRPWLNGRDHAKALKIAACSSEKNSGGNGGLESQSQSSFLSRSQTYALLKQQMEVAAKSEVRFFVIYYCLRLCGRKCMRVYASNLQANLIVGFSNFCKFTLIFGSVVHSC